MRATLEPIDWGIIAAYGVVVLAVGVGFAKRASRGVESFFVGKRNLPWWIAGTSAVATTFAADTPLAVTGIVATGGVSGNWIWWSWAIAHLTATFFFARLWRRSGVITDAEITELRYSGRVAAALRGFKAVYFGVFINCLTMAWVIAAMVKISQAFFDIPATHVILASVSVAVAYTVLGGFHSVVVSDLLQFVLGMAGAVALAVLTVQSFGGMGSLETDAESGLLPALRQTLALEGRDVHDVVALIPGPDNAQMPWVLFIVLLVAGWWRYAEGTGYNVQRLAACKDEGHAQGASLWFAVAHNAIRPWPWIVVGLAALVVYPVLAERPSTEIVLRDVGGESLIIRPGYLDVHNGGVLEVVGGQAGMVVDILGQRVEVARSKHGAWQAHFSGPGRTQRAAVTVLDGETGRRYIGEGFIVQLGDREQAYPLLMGRFLPPGLLGLVIASLLAAFMSTIDTHANWGASYLVQDVYRRFVAPGASEQAGVWVGRACVVGMAALAGATATVIESIASVWMFLIMLGAGLGSVTAARWYWWRVTAWAEFATMATTTLLAIALQLICTETLFGGPNPWFVFAVPTWAKIVLVAATSLASWIPMAIWGPREDLAHLRRFCARVQPSGPGWAAIRDRQGAHPLTGAAMRFLGGTVVVFASLVGIGYLVLGSSVAGLALLAAAGLALTLIVRSGYRGCRFSPLGRLRGPR